MIYFSFFLKGLKDYLRSSISDDRLASLMVWLWSEKGLRKSPLTILLMIAKMKPRRYLLIH